MTPTRPPIFLLSTGRAGSTVLFKVMTWHPEVAYLTGFADPGLFQIPIRRLQKSGALPTLKLNRLILRAADLPCLGQLVRYVGKPVEVYPFWQQCTGGIINPFRDLRADDVTDRNRVRAGQVPSELCTGSRTIPLFKMTGWPRVGFLNEIFPEAIFIHLIRDGRAVANSFMNVGFWDGWQGPRQWRCGQLPPHYQAEWEEYGRSFVALAGIHWKILVDAFEKACAAVAPDRWWTMRYEDFCAAPREVLKDLCEYLELEWSQRLDKAIGSTELKSRNNKWRDDLSPQQQAVLEQVLDSHLRKYGYLE